MASAASFALSTTSVAKAVRAFTAAVARVSSPDVALIFVSGDLAGEDRRLAKALSQEFPKLPFVLAVGAGVLNERQEFEGESAASGLAWRDPTARVLGFETGSEDHASKLESIMAACDASTALVFMRPDQLDAAVLPRLALRGRSIFGAGTSSNRNILVHTGGGELHSAPTAALLSRATPPLLASTRASRLITQLSPITKTSGNLVLEIAGEDALDVLSNAGQGLEGQPLIYVALAPAAVATSSSPRSANVLVRPVQGIDPVRRGIMLGEPVNPGTFAAFAVRDPDVARSDLEAALRELERDSAGSMPRFAIYINCAGRGSGLYEVPNVDTRMIRARFGAIPVVGLQSAFELAPYTDHLALHLYTGVLGLFTAPS